MIDWYLLLTPLLVLPIFLLFRFVGCDRLFGLDPVYSYYDKVFGLSSLVSFWLLADQNTAQAKDEKNAHHGLYGQPAATSDQPPSQGASGEALQGQDGVRIKGKKCVDFEGGYVAVPFDAALNTASFTVEAWVLAGDWRPGFDHAAVTSAEVEGMFPSTFRGFSIFARWNPATQKSYWSASIGTGATFVDITGPEVKMPPTPTYLVLSHNAGTGTATFYVATTGNNWDALLPTQVSGYMPALSNPLYIGANSLTVPPQPLPPPPPQTAPPVAYPFIGRIQEVAIYNAAVSDADLAVHRGYYYTA